MDSTPDIETRRAQYRATVEALERIRAQELAAMTDEEALRQIKLLSVSTPPWRERPDWSGLVEQQALFMRGEKVMNVLNNVMAAAVEIQTFCRQKQWQFCFIGGIAVQRWGTPRFTQDVDLTLLTGYGDEAKYIDALLSIFSGRFPDSKTFALQNRVLLLRAANGVDVDIALGAFPFEAGAILRASAWNVTDQISILTCSAEDLVVHKVFAGRDRDWGDIESILVRRHGQLNLAHIRAELPPLLDLKEETESLGKFERMIKAIDARLKK